MKKNYKKLETISLKNAKSIVEFFINAFLRALAYVLSGYVFG